MTSKEQVRRRRPWVYALAAVVGGILALGLVTALVASPLAAIKTQDDFTTYREAQDKRSAKAAKDREALAAQVSDLTRQNTDLQRQLAAFSRLLRKVGIDPSDPTLVVPPRSSVPVNPSSQSTRSATPTPKSAPKPAPAPKPRPTPRPAPTPQPAPVPDPVKVCLPVVGCVL